jgi:hypothetical protein
MQADEAYTDALAGTPVSRGARKGISPHVLAFLPVRVRHVPEIVRTRVSRIDVYAPTFLLAVPQQRRQRQRKG